MRARPRCRQTPDAEIVAGAAVTLHTFILMVEASYTGLAQITDYSLHQLGSDAIPRGQLKFDTCHPFFAPRRSVGK